MRLRAIKTIKTPLYLWGQWSGAGTGAVGAASPRVLRAGGTAADPGGQPGPG